MKRNVYIKIAYWYYTLGMTQDAIAKRLSFTRQKVNQIINSLPDLNIVSIHIHGYEQDNVELESRIEERYGLNQVMVASDYGEHETAIYKVTNVAAQYLDESLQQGDIIGISWGRTLTSVVNQMSYKKKSNCRVIQILGAQNMELKSKKSDETVRDLANKLDCPSYMLYAPVIVENPETKNWLLKEKSVIMSLDLMNKCNVVVISVGELTEKATMTTSGYLTIDDIKKLRGEGFVGELAMNPLRKDGSSDNCSLSPRLLNAGIESLKNIDNTILIACGLEKKDAIKAALNSGCVNTLIIDETTARAIIEDED